MNYFVALLKVEFFKVQKSKTIWLTALAFTIAPLMASFFMFILKNPEFAQSAGFVGAKAQIVGEASWPSLLKLQAQIIAVGGSFVFGFVNSWVFGREFSDKTANNLLVLPFSRSLIVIAKFLITFLINFLLSCYIVILTFIICYFIDLPNLSINILKSGLSVIFIITILTLLLSTPVAFLASYSRGFLAPLGFIIIVIIFAQILSAIGFGDFFPWSILALLSETLFVEKSIDAISLIIVLFTSLLGIVGTTFWWLFADHN